MVPCGVPCGAPWCARGESENRRIRESENTRIRGYEDTRIRESENVRMCPKKGLNLCLLLTSLYFTLLCLHFDAIQVWHLLHFAPLCHLGIMHSKSWIRWIQKSADDFEFSAERLSENAKSIKITLFAELLTVPYLRDSAFPRSEAE